MGVIALSVSILRDLSSFAVSCSIHAFEDFTISYMIAQGFTKERVMGSHPIKTETEHNIYSLDTTSDCHFNFLKLPVTGDGFERVSFDYDPFELAKTKPSTESFQIIYQILTPWYLDSPLEKNFFHSRH